MHDLPKVASTFKGNAARAKALLEGKSLVPCRLFKRGSYDEHGSYCESCFIKVPRFLFGWKWLRSHESWPWKKIRFDSPSQAIMWIRATYENQKSFRVVELEEMEIE
jgi:hypothetical protein